ncbi:hypothetical protein LTR49_000383 [Elasticomyces elasticus]|nr:hypothetical protein LTR49_000383 [Elasticomyces elasticus]
MLLKTLLEFFSLSLILQTRLAATTEFVTFHSNPDCVPDASSWPGTGAADGVCQKISGQHQWCRTTVGDSTYYDITISDDSSCSSDNNFVLAEYGHCYNATGYTYFMVTRVNANPVSSTNGTDGAASPTTPVNANPTNGTGAAVPPNKDHGLSKAAVLGPAIGIPLFFVFVCLALYIHFRQRINKIVRQICGHRIEEPRSDEAPIMLDIGVPQNRSKSCGGPRDAAVSQDRNVLPPGPTLTDSPTARDVPYPQHPDDFEIAIVCALKLERNAVVALMEVNFNDQDITFEKAIGDRNTYTTGMLGGKPVVLTGLRDMGNVNSAIAASDLDKSFTKIKFCFVVGVAGGAPCTPDGSQIWLGDIVISTALVQYDFGRQYPDRFVRKGQIESTFKRPQPEVANHVEHLKGNDAMVRLTRKINESLDRLASRTPRYARPSCDSDRLFKPNYRHKHRDTYNCEECHACTEWDDSVCEEAYKMDCYELGCDDGETLRRRGSLARRPEDRLETEARLPSIHFDRVASGNAVMKSGIHRDRLIAQEKVIAFEMEGAGVWDQLPTIIVKSVCDYSDSHKNKAWQDFAAATAASCTKAIIEEWNPAGRRTA